MEARDEQQHFNRLVLRYRTRAGMTQQQLADFSTISVRAIRDLEHGRARRPRRDTVRLIADALRLNDRDRARLEASAGRFNHRTRLRNGPSGAAAAPPRPSVPLVGRDDEADALTAELSGSGARLVTVTGIAGVGKSSLATEAAGRLHQRLDLPVLWTAPGTADDPEAALPGAVVDALYGIGGPDAREHVRALSDAVGDEHALLFVDAARPTALAGAAVAELLADCPNLRLLSTADRPHRVDGEQVFLLDPPRREDAVAVLRTRISQAGAAVAPEGDDGTVLGEICALLDHLPGALGAVSSWAAVYDTATLLDSLTREPVPLLTPLGPGSGPDAAASLRRSLAGCTSHEEAVLNVLCASPDGERPDALASRSGLSLADCGRGLASLIVRGLVQRDRLRAEPRFHTLNLVRALRGTDTVQDEHMELAL